VTRQAPLATMPDRRMRAAGSRRGYHLDSISRQVRPEDLERFDHIIAMDHDNMENLRSMGNVSDGKARLSLMCDYARNHDDRVVPDPYYGGDRGFEHVMDLLEDACQGLLEELTRPKA
jgi:protein-tyrosine phosphatase